MQHKAAKFELCAWK